MPSFQLGQIIATPGALAALRDASETPQTLLGRHRRLEAGELSRADQNANKAALSDGSRILSSFRLSTGEKIWVITEAVGDDGFRASTCILLPDEY